MKTLAGYELTGYLKLQANIRAQFIEFDEDYAPVSKRFILEVFSPYFEGILRRKKKLIPRKQSNDCDKFARRAALEAIDLHDDTRPGKSSIAFGVLKYRIGGEVGKEHWINVGANWKATGPVILNVFFYEPMTRSEVFLTQQELFTCEYVII